MDTLRDQSWYKGKEFPDWPFTGPLGSPANVEIHKAGGQQITPAPMMEVGVPQEDLSPFSYHSLATSRGCNCNIFSPDNSTGCSGITYDLY